MSAVAKHFPTGHRLRRLGRDASAALHASPNASPDQAELLHVPVPGGIVIEARADGMLLIHLHRTDLSDALVKHFIDVLARMNASHASMLARIGD